MFDIRENNAPPSFTVLVHNRLHHAISVIAPGSAQSSHATFPTPGLLRGSSSSLTLPQDPALFDDFPVPTIPPRTSRRILLPRDAIRSRRLDLTLRPHDFKNEDLHSVSAGEKGQRHRLRILGTRSRREEGAAKPSSTAQRWTKARCLDLGKAQAGFWALQTLPRTDAEELELLLFPARATESFLSEIPDEAMLSALAIPGSHETFARYGWPIAKCQEVSSTILKQLLDGLRFMDFRVTPKGDLGQERLLAYHGSTDERIELSDALSQVYAFLRGAGSRETVLISIKPEKGDPRLMERLLFDLYVGEDEEMWYLDNRIPCLGEVRGRIVMLSRFGQADEEPGGIHPPVWPNNHKGTFEYDLPTNQKVRTQDWYNLSSWRNIPVKFDLALQLLNEAGAEPDVFALNFISAATFPMATPPVVAKGLFERGVGGTRCLTIEGMNVRLLNSVASILASSTSAEAQFRSRTAKQDSTVDAQQGPSAAIDCRLRSTPGLQACFALDFYDHDNADALVPLLIEANFCDEMGVVDGPAPC